MTFYFLDISPKKTSGLCNQIYFISSMCSYALKNNIKYIFLNKFLKEINTDNYCPISEIIDFKKTNNFLKKYNIVLFDSFNIKFDILDIKYGNDLYNINVTDICKIKYKNSNRDNSWDCNNYLYYLILVFISIINTLNTNFE